MQWIVKRVGYCLDFPPFLKMSIFTSVLKLHAESFCSFLAGLSSILFTFFTFLNIANKLGLSPFDEVFLTFLSFKILTSFFLKSKSQTLCSFRINRKHFHFFLYIPHMSDCAWYWKAHTCNVASVVLISFLHYAVKNLCQYL